jgi:formamidopyrimidine-DNA glycosylase
MPELPEVEAVRLQLTKYLVGHTIKNVVVKTKKVFPDDPGKVVNAKIIGLRRFGKLLVIDLSNDYSLLMHFKLTGQPIYRGPNLKSPPKLSNKVFGGVPGKHSYVIINLDKGGVFYYNDLRKFGWIKIVPTSKVESESFVKNLGPEPLKDLTLEKFKQVISKTQRAIKIVLMDQTKIAGVGNIYANDTIWLDGISPKRPANKLTPKEMVSLFNSVIKVLKDGINKGGSSEHAFVTPDGAEGHYQDFTLVYDKKGEKCKRCHSEIKKIQLGGRGTYFCPKCQK